MFEKTPSRYSMPPYRAGIAVLLQYQDQFVACRRAKETFWQCVQGGIDSADVSVSHAVHRELQEELGIQNGLAKVKQRSLYWRRYHFPPEVLAKGGLFLGQDQLWFFAEIPSLDCIKLEKSCGEFDKFELRSSKQLLDGMVEWKRPLLVDFCKEIGLG